MGWARMTSVSLAINQLALSDAVRSRNELTTTTSATGLICTARAISWPGWFRFARAPFVLDGCQCGKCVVDSERVVPRIGVNRVVVVIYEVLRDNGINHRHAGDAVATRLGVRV